METVRKKTLKVVTMERLNLSSMMVAILGKDEMMNVRGGDGGTTPPPPPPVKTGTEEDIIL